jgi:uncharacterized membrane protein YkvA (DUF1232 family)
MKDFDQLLEEDIAEYDGPYSALISRAPAFFRLLAALLADPALPGRWRPLILAAIAYFILPADIMPEDLSGPVGYADDLFLCAFLVNEIRQEQGSLEILERNWYGDTPLLPLVKEILALETELIGDRRELVLWFIGYEHLQ